MQSPPQRANIVLEHASAFGDYDEQSHDDSWFVVAYLVHESGQRRRVTLHRFEDRADAVAALESIWDKVISAVDVAAQ